MKLKNARLEYEGGKYDVIYIQEGKGNPKTIRTVEIREKTEKADMVWGIRVTNEQNKEPQFELLGPSKEIPEEIRKNTYKLLGLVRNVMGI